MSTETGEETIRYLIDKYISKPNQHQDEENEEELVDSSSLIISEKVMERVNMFLIKHLEESQRIKIQQ